MLKLLEDINKLPDGLWWCCGTLAVIATILIHSSAELKIENGEQKLHLKNVIIQSEQDTQTRAVLNERIRGLTKDIEDLRMASHSAKYCSEIKNKVEEVGQSVDGLKPVFEEVEIHSEELDRVINEAEEILID